MIASLVDHLGNPVISSPAKEERRKQAWDRILARFDAAQTNSENENHWKWADGLSASTAHSPDVRKKLRQRSRYETANNSYLKGMVLTLANSTIGCGPRLQLLTPDPELNTFIEREFMDWAWEIGLAEKLRTAEQSAIVDGEAFLLRTANWRNDTPVKTDIKLIESDQIATPYVDLNPDAVDGLEISPDGYVDAFHMLDRHPGDNGYGSLMSHTISWLNMVHVYRDDRPGQRRGIPETTPALPLFSTLRRFVLAVLGSAEVAADYAAIMYTDSNALEAEDIPNLDPNDAIPIDRRVFQILPNGWKMSQLKAEQPTTTFGEFRNAIINEAARCILMPYNLATGNSSSYNFASGRLDYHIWEQAVKTRQQERQRSSCKSALRWWFEEARLIPGYLPAGLRWVDLRGAHTWLWPAITGPIDQLKDAKAVETNLRTGMTHRGRELAKLGIDADQHDDEAARFEGYSSREEYRQAISQTLRKAPTSTPSADDQPEDVQESIDASVMRWRGERSHAGI